MIEATGSHGARQWWRGWPITSGRWPNGSPCRPCDTVRPRGDFCGVAEYFEETYDYAEPLKLPLPRPDKPTASQGDMPDVDAGDQPDAPDAEPGGTGRRD